MKLKYLALSVCAAALMSCNSDKPVAADPTLKDILGNKFLVGVAINSEQTVGRDTSGVDVVRRHFNSIVAENCMKSEVIHPEEDRYDFSLADEFVKFGEDNGMFIIGHCLVWHSQLSPWFCVDADGKNVSPEVLKERLRSHIHTIVGRYKGRIKGWDVVNEAIEGDGSYRKSKFYEILGEEYIPLAFQYAHEADPEAELYYNDYGMHEPGRRDAVVRMVNSLKEKGLRVDAIGMQGHIRAFPIAQQFMAEECAGETGIVSDREYRSIAFFFHVNDAVATIHAHVARFDGYIHFRTFRCTAYYIIACV